MLNKEEIVDRKERSTLFGFSLDFSKTIASRNIETELEDLCQDNRLEANIRSNGNFFQTAPVLTETILDKTTFFTNKTSIG